MGGSNPFLNGLIAMGNVQFASDAAVGPGRRVWFCEAGNYTASWERPFCEVREKFDGEHWKKSCA